MSDASTFIHHENYSDELDIDEDCALEESEGHAPAPSPPAPSSYPDTLSAMLGEMKRQGVDMQLQRIHKPSGKYVDAKPEEVELLKCQAKLAKTAKVLQELPTHERTEWAVASKEAANEVFRGGDFKRATDMYMETLTGANFDSSSPYCNVDSVVVPVLCNLAACAIQQEEWTKAFAFCNQALQLRPENVRALSRRARVHLHHKQFAEAQVDLVRAWKLVAAADSRQVPKDTSKGSDEDADAVAASEPRPWTSEIAEAVVPEPMDSLRGAASWQRELAPLLRQAQLGLRLEAESVKKRKEAMKKAFAEANKEPDSNEVSHKYQDIRSGAPFKDDAPGRRHWLQSLASSSLARRALSLVAGAVLVFLRALLSVLRSFLALPSSTPAAEPTQASHLSSSSRSAKNDAS